MLLRWYFGACKGGLKNTLVVHAPEDAKGEQTSHNQGGDEPANKAKPRERCCIFHYVGILPQNFSALLGAYPQ